MSKPRLWPVYLIFAALGVWLAQAWWLGERIRQERVLASLSGVIFAGVLLLLWLLAFSRLAWRTRLLGLLATVVVLGAGAAAFRIRGLSGDVAPILELRWGRETPPQLPGALPPAASSAPPMAPAASATETVTPSSEPAAAASAASAAGPTGATAPAPPITATAEEPILEGTAEGQRAADATAAVPSPDALGQAAPDAWPQFLGPDRNGTLSGPRLARDWTAEPPRLVWRQAIGEGWSSFAVARGLAVTQEQRGDDEMVVAYDLATGRPVWSHADPVRFEVVPGGIGPRATPAIAAGRVFTMGATGILNALDLATGQRLWTRQVVEENAVTLPEWGKSSSPLVIGERVIVSVGGGNGRSLIAYAAADGRELWAAGDGGSGYSSPQLSTLLGRSQVVIFNRANVAGHDPHSGVVLWEHPWPGQAATVAQPLVLDADRLLVSAGYGIGSKLFAFKAGGEAGSGSGEIAVEMVWESPRLKSKFANMVTHDGFVYGLDDGVLVCLDPASGERRWKGGRYGHGQLLLVGELLLVSGEDGEVILIDPTPAEHRELGRFTALDGAGWNPPVLVGAQLLLRNDREVALFELPLAH